VELNGHHASLPLGAAWQLPAILAIGHPPWLHACRVKVEMMKVEILPGEGGDTAG
jgi:hypothetical protein